MMQLGNVLEKVKQKSPLIHNITNNVTANDCANILLACGASPIMAEDPLEVEEVTAISAGLCVNLGTLSPSKAEAILLAGKKANELRHPVLLDPVGAGISQLRIQTAGELLEKVKFAAIRGNISEIQALVSGKGSARGVDAEASGATGQKENLAVFARKVAAKYQTVVVISGESDIVADEKNAYAVYNGHPFMRKVTGSGCQLTSLMAACVTANQEKVLTAVLAAVCWMGICGEKAFQRLTPQEGNATYRNYMIDAVCRLTPEELDAGARYEKIL